jgi:hypothetical protein
MQAVNKHSPKTKEEVMRRLIITLVLSVMALGFALPAFAGPFTDVPTDHWAYDAIDKLQAEGFVEGYPDGTFRGNRSFTRYEMAMVVARIWDRLQTELQEIYEMDWDVGPVATPSDVQGVMDMVEDLRDEFGPELDALGMRLDDHDGWIASAEDRLAALEDGLGNIQLTGALRTRIEDIITNDYETHGGFMNPAGAGQHAGIIAGTPGSNPGEMFEVETLLDVAMDASPSDYLDVHVMLQYLGSYLDYDMAQPLVIDEAWAKADMMKLMGWEPTEWWDRFNLTVGYQYGTFGEFGLAFDNGFDSRPGIHIDFGGDRLELRALLARSTRFGEQEGLAIGRASYAFGDSRSTVTPGDHFARVGFNYLGTGVGNEQGMGVDLDTELLSEVYLNRLRVEYFQLEQDQLGFDVSASYGDDFESSLIAWVDLYNNGNTRVFAAYADIGLVPGFSSIDNNPFEEYDALFTGVGGNINYAYESGLNPFPSNFVGGGLQVEHTWWDVLNTMLTMYDGTNQAEEDYPVVIRLNVRYPLSDASDIALEYIHSGIDALSLAKLRGEFLVRF